MQAGRRGPWTTPRCWGDNWGTVAPRKPGLPPATGASPKSTKRTTNKHRARTPKVSVMTLSRPTIANIGTMNNRTGRTTKRTPEHTPREHSISDTHRNHFKAQGRFRGRPHGAGRAHSPLLTLGRPPELSAPSNPNRNCLQFCNRKVPPKGFPAASATCSVFQAQNDRNC